jgi:hypothetical protein
LSIRADCSLYISNKYFVAFSVQYCGVHDKLTREDEDIEASSSSFSVFIPATDNNA